MPMTVLVGIDEAGYGPNLGPLVISATAWQIPDADHETDLYALLHRAVTDRPRSATATCVCIADSKQVYKPRGGLAALEYGVLSAMRLFEPAPETWQTLWETLAGQRGAHRQPLPWYEDFSIPIPVDAKADRIASLTRSIENDLRENRASLMMIRSVAVFPDEFNRLTQQFGSKGAALTRLTLELLGDILDQTGDQRTLVVCDKHGGRNRYAAALQHNFPDYLIEIHGEGRAQSVYRWGPEDQRVEVRFQTRGEQFLPAALASMTSKYLRELAMRAFNDFWCSRVPNLTATAGYPVDAKRFKAAIAATQTELGIDDQLLWRIR
jgi:hypothetical protein